MIAQPLSLPPGHRLGEGTVLSDLVAIDAGIERDMVTRAEVLIEWVEENEVPAEPDRWGTAVDAGAATATSSSGTGRTLEATADELGPRRLRRDLDGLLMGRPVAIAGDGAPMVSDLALVDLAAALGRSVVSATRLVGGICELAYRLPLIWARIRAQEVALWRGLRVAEKTITLTWPAAAEVDTELVSAIGSCSWAQVDRCVQAAIERHRAHDEAESSDGEDEATDTGPVEDDRGFDIHLRDAGNSGHLFTGADSSGIGLIGAEGTLEAADAVDLEHAIRDLAQQLAQAGSTEPLGVRRAKALGMLARGEVPLPVAATTTGVDASTHGENATTIGEGALSAGSGMGTALGLPTGPAGPPTVGAGSRRNVLLVLHLNEAAINGAERVGRCENTLAPASIDQIKDWCAGAKVKVHPVLDIVDHHPVGTYEIPDRIRAQVSYRDTECVFPHCHTPARSCDLDHIVPFEQGGPTCACNLAPLCRRHHRAKTARRWGYVMLHPGSYYWRAPSGATYLVDAHGTHTLPDLSDEGAAHRYRRRCPSELAGHRPTTTGVPRGGAENRTKPPPEPSPDPPPF